MCKGLLQSHIASQALSTTSFTKLWWLNIIKKLSTTWKAQIPTYSTYIIAAM